MAILSITDSGFAGNLKNYYQKFRQDQFNLVTKLFAQIEKIKPGGPSNMRWGGNGAVFDILVSDPAGGQFSSAGYLPDSVMRDEVQCTVGISRGYVRKQYDRLAWIGTNNKAAAFVSLAQKIDKEIRDDYRQMMQEALHGNGTAIKALVSNVVSTTVFDVTSPYGVANTGQGGLWVRKGQKIAILDTSASDVVLGRATVSSVVLQTAPDTYRVTVDTAISSVAATDKFVAATSSDTAFNAMPNGLINITNRGASYNSLHGQSAATYTRWNAGASMTAGTDTPRVEQLLEDDLVELMMRVAGKSGQDARENPDEFIFVTTPGLKKSFVQQFLGQREVYLKDTGTKLNGGYTTDASCNGVPIIDDPYCPAGTVYLIHKPSLGWVDALDFGSVVQESESPWRFIADRDAYETSSAIYFNIATTQRNAHGSIVGYTDTNRYSPLAA